MNEPQSQGKEKMYIGVDIGGTRMKAALVDGVGRVLERRAVPTNILEGAEQTSTRLAEVCFGLIERASALGGRAKAVGLGVAGKIDSGRGRVIFSPNLPAMRDYPLAVELEGRLKLPVFMENDANAFGIGESRGGAAQGVSNWIGVTLGTGVGGCLVFGENVWQGDGLGFVGEIGHTMVDPKGPSCVCGLKGCLEAHSSGRALIEGVERAVSEGILTAGPLYDCFMARALIPEGVFSFAKAGDLLAVGLFERMGWALGVALAGAVSILGVRHAVIGGGVSAGWDFFIGSLKKSFAEHSCMISIDEMRILRGALSDDAAPIGAARLAQERVLASGG